MHPNNKTNNKTGFRLAGYIIAALTFVVFLSTCTFTIPGLAPPANTAIPIIADGLIRDMAWQSCYSLPDGTDIFFAADTRIKVIKMAGWTDNASDHEVFLVKGAILIQSALPEVEYAYRALDIIRGIFHEYVNDARAYH